MREAPFGSFGMICRFFVRQDRIGDCQGIIDVGVESGRQVLNIIGNILLLYAGFFEDIDSLVVGNCRMDLRFVSADQKGAAHVDPCLKGFLVLVPDAADTVIAVENFDIFVQTSASAASVRFHTDLKSDEQTIYEGAVS